MTKDKVELVNAEQSAVATSDIPALSADVRRVIEFVATWRGLYAHTTNVEEGNYLRCLRCNGESVQHGRDLTPADVAHDKGCPIALAKAILPTLSCAGVASVADWQSLRSRLIKLAAKAVTGEGFLSPFVDDLPKSTPASIVRQAGAQRETLRLWGIEMREIAGKLSPSTSDTGEPPEQDHGSDPIELTKAFMEETYGPLSESDDQDSRLEKYGVAFAAIVFALGRVAALSARNKDQQDQESVR